MTNAPNYDTAIALIGMAGRFPGAQDVEAFWRNLVAGHKSIRFFTDDELLAAGIPPENLTQPDYVKAGAVLEDGDMFDAPFFKFSPREAEITDPQHRVFLECAWTALEDAGYDPETYPDLIGVFAGSALSTYLLNNIYPNDEVMSIVGGMQAVIGNDKDSLASLVSYKLNLRGPAIAIQTFCSTSLVATHLACQSLLNYECDIALAGGVALATPQVAGYTYEEGGILSPDGECRTFDANGGGSVMGNGVGIVALKRLEEALQDGDQIYAVLLGSAINNDGSVRVSYTAPGLNGQTEVIAQAMSNAQVEPETIGYVETHGTATMLGDSVEVAAMTKAFRRGTNEQQFCAIGSVKPNIGHLDRASGVTGLMKAALILKHGQIPPSLNFQQANPDLHLSSSPFYVNTELRDWERGETPRRAGVSSFGVGGTNAHVVLEETPEIAPSDPARPWQLLLLSARTEQALETATANLATHLRTHDDLNLADVAYTLQVGRSAFNQRRFVVCRDRADALNSLLASDALQLSSARQVYRGRPVIFVLSGTYNESCMKMLLSLYREEPAFRAHVETCLALSREWTGRNLRGLFVNQTLPTTEQDQQAACFLTTYALASTLLQWGIQPQALYGSGAGMLVAACVAGVLSLEDGLRIMVGAEDPEQVLRSCVLRTSEMPLFSARMGAALTSEQATDPAFWLSHLSADTGAADDVGSFLQETEGVLLEVGWGQARETLFQAHPAYNEERHAQVRAFFHDEESGRAALLRTLGQLWLAGATIGWSALSGDERRRRVSLPTYPFERQRHWLQSAAEQNAASRALASARNSKHPDCADWFYQEQWTVTPLPQDDEAAPAQHTWLVFLDSTGAGEAIARRLESRDQRIIRIYAGETFAQQDEQRFHIRSGEQADYEQVCDLLIQRGWSPTRVLHGWGTQSAPEHAALTPASFRNRQESGFYSLLTLARVLAARIYDEPVQMLVLAENALSVTGQEDLRAENVPLLGACKTISQEPLNVFCRYLDLERPAGGNWDDTPALEALVADCLRPNNEPVVAYRDTRRLAQSYEAISLPPATPDALPFRQQGVYLITGGLGNIGLALAEHLATGFQARLVLISRSALPERAAWSDWLASHEEQESVSRRIRALQRIEEAGGEVRLYSADSADPAQMRAIVQETRAAFGALHGVFHAAGTTSPDAFKAIQNISRDDCEQHFQAKVYGTLALTEALAGVELDFCLLFSSLSAVLGGLGFSAYTAANLFMDALVSRQQRATKQRWLSVNWDTWQFEGASNDALGATVLAFAMTPPEGIEALTRVLASTHTRLVNSTGDLAARIEQWISRTWPEESANDDEQETFTATVRAQVSEEEYTQKVIEIWQQVLGLKQVGLYENFFDLGGNSLVALDVISRLKKAFRRPIPVVALFDAPTVSALARYLQETDEALPAQKSGASSQKRQRREQVVGQDGIAIIGMAGRFPGASTIEQFWENLRAGKETITVFSTEELLAAGVPPEVLRDPTYVKARPVLDQVDQFDANFFGYSPREAELTDPQHRLFLECAWEALESAGYDSQTLEQAVGVFGGANFSTYLLSLVANFPETLQTIDGFQLSIGNDKDSLTTTVSYKLNLRGPSFAVQTFCSTSLVATHLACQSLLLGECEMALAGGVSIRVPNRVGYFYQEGGQESSDGHCRTFDEQSQGSVLGDGVGVIVLKRLSDALADGDTIHAVIKGSAINNDGALKVSYSAPSVTGQAEVVSRALENAGVDAASIGYIEAHGTATKLGDPIEVASLTRAFRAQTEEVGYCAIGSVKTNMGHLDRAAGITGLMKAVLALKHEQIPASLHYQAPNPEIDFAHSPFYVNTELRPWPRQAAPRRAGINSLGMGGTNVHVVIEEAPEQDAVSPDQPWQLLPLSARTETALQRMAANLCVYLQEHPEVALADVAYTLQIGRGVFEYRQALLCQNRADALAALAAVAKGERAAIYQTRRDLPVDLTLPSGARTIEEREEVLSTLGRAWLDGGKVDWMRLYANEKRRRVPLPTYPFERQRYWLEPDRQKRAAAAQSTSQASIEREKDLADWFYEAVWAAEPLEETSPIAARYPWLVFATAGGPGEQIAAQMEAQGYPITRVYAGQYFAASGAHTFHIRPGECADYVQLCAALAENATLPRRILHCWSVEPRQARAAISAEELSKSQESGFYSLLYLAQALAPHIYAEPVQVLVVTANVQAVRAGEPTRVEHAPLQGASKVIQQEPLNIACRSIDLALNDARSWEESATLEQLLAECVGSATDLAVAYREQTRLVERYQASPLPSLQKEMQPFRQQGVYLITGGLGGIGLALAEYLARTVQARLILLARSPLPARQQWPLWLEQHAQDDEVSQKIRRLQQIEQTGGQLLIRQVNVADEQALRDVIQEARDTFGTLHGVFHAAGIVDPRFFKSILDMSADDCEPHFQGKLYGTLALARALQDTRLDFCLLFSSLSAVLGGLGFVAYSAANLFLDKCAHLFNQASQSRWISVNWDTWKVLANAHGSLGGTIAAFAMEPAEALEALTRVVGHAKNNLVNSTGDLHARLAQWMNDDLLRESNASLLDGASAATLIPASGDYEQKIREIWQDVLGVAEVGLYDNFFELGGNSLIALEVIAKLKKAFRQPVSAVALFEAPTISMLVQYLQPAAPQSTHQAQDKLEARRKKTRQTGTRGIALIGMSGRFPGAPTIEQFWDNLRQGVESISFFTPEELAEAGVPAELIHAPNYVPARPVLEDEIVRSFDAAFFGYSPREAELTDPQHRLFLECAWEALELAGYDTQTYKGLVGVFGGTNISTYMLTAEPASLSGINTYQLLAGNDKDSLTTSVSYKLNLRGPSLAVQTFCSTSLVAVHLASQSLLNGECDLALAGGSSICVPAVNGHLYEPGGMESPDGHCRTFDAQAKGSMFGDGVGVVALKRLEDALEDGDYIYGVIKGSAINNDGSLKVSYAAPSVAGQAEVVQAALANAGVSAESISYVEAHGTATELGDPIEVASLTKAFHSHTEKNGYCAIGSVKTNVGHLDRAAGVSGLLKTILALHYEQIPPSLHYQSPNPEIDFVHSPFYVNTQLKPWPRTTTPRRAGINSLGMGGTNAHVVVEEAPARQPSGPSRPWQSLVFSARTETALEQVQQRFTKFLKQHEDANLADIAYTLAAGRRRFEYRSVLLCRDRADALEQLQKTLPYQLESRVDRPVSFLFSGVGEHYAGMAHELYQQERLFREIVDECCTLLKDLLGRDIRDVLFATEPLGKRAGNGNGQSNGNGNVYEQPAPHGLDLRALLGREQNNHANGQHANGQRAQQEELKRTELAQPALFVVEYALARLLMQWGLRPEAMLGYSLGEYVAACLAGVFSLADALKLVAQRALLISELPAGSMLAVSLPPSDVLSYLDTEISLAAINSPGACVLAGEASAIEDLCTQLSLDGVAWKRVETTHAFHSSMLEPAGARLTALARTIRLHAPKIPYISNVTGAWITAEQATDPAYWAQHMCQTVQFAEGVAHLLQETESALLEVGPGQSLASFVRQHPACDRERMALISATLPAVQERQPEQRYLLQALGRLWQAGAPIEWSEFYAEEKRQRLPLPTYPFERQSYWLAMRKGQPGSFSMPGSQLIESISELPKRELADWFYLPGWKQVAPIQATPVEEATDWLLFLDSCGLGIQLAEQLRAGNQTVSIVQPGTGFVRLDDERYTVRPAEREDYDELLRDLRARGRSFQRILHLWSVSDVQADTEQVLQEGFYSLFALAQALGDTGHEHCQITMVSAGALQVTGHEELHPARATLIGPCRVLPQEFPALQCRAIDITLPQPGTRQETLCVRQLLTEIQAAITELLIALRGNRRWVPTFEPMHLEATTQESAPLREQGVYLITGGLGGIGLALAEFFASEVQAKIALVGRTALPPRQTWPELLASQAEDRTAQRIREILAIEALGAEVLIIAADVTDAAQMRTAIEQTEATFGALHGIVHAAGLPGQGLTQLKTREQAARVLAPKIQGTLALEEALAGRPLDFLALCSSVVSATGGGPGQIDYCAANAFLDAYAQSRASAGMPVVSIDWGEWQWNAWEAGLAGYDQEVQDFLRQHREEFGIPSTEGVEALRRVLAAHQAHVVVSTQDFRVLAEQSRQFSAATLQQQRQELQQARPAHPRPNLARPYAPPRNETEQQIAAIWEDLLGISPVGIDDNFFELGGNSLNGIDLIARLRKTFGLETLASHVLYEASSVGALARYIEKGKSNTTVKERLERGEKRRDSLKQRAHGNRKTR